MTVPGNHDEYEALEALLSRRQLIRGGAAIGAGLGLSGLLAACGSSSTAGGGSGSSGGATKNQIVLDLADEPPSWNTLKNNIQYLRWVTDQVQETLYGYDNSMKLVAVLADGMPVQTDPLHATIKVKKGIPWHNGDMLTAADVAATFNAAKEEGSIWAGPLSYLEHAEAVDDVTTRFTYNKPYTGLLDYATIIPMMNKDYIKSTTVAMGTGPYQWGKYVKGTSVTLKAFPKYRGGAPKTPNVLFNIVPDSSTQLVNILQGQSDILPMPAYAQVSSLKKNNKVVVYEHDAPVDIFFWLSAKEIPDVRIRQAIVYAMDRQKVVQVAYDGYATPGQGPIPPSNEGYAGAAKLFTPGPNYEKARALMKEAGQSSFSFKYISTVEPQQKAMAQVLQQSWAEVGLKADLELSTYDAWQTAWVGGNWGISTLFSMDGFSSGRGGWAMTDTLRSDNPVNFGKFSDPKMDKILNGVYDAPTEAARIKLWSEASTLCQQEACQVPPVYPKFLLATGAGVKGLPTAQFEVTKIDLRNVTVQS
jgi:peptide/nickel transport system substrate-binding protein